MRGPTIGSSVLVTGQEPSRPGANGKREREQSDGDEHGGPSPWAVLPGLAQLLLLPQTAKSTR